MKKLLPLALLSLCSSCVTSENSISVGGLPSVQPVEAALMAEPDLSGEQGFSESLLHFGIRDTPLSLVVGYGSAEPSHVQDEFSSVAAEHRAEARPSLGFSLSF